MYDQLKSISNFTDIPASPRNHFRLHFFAAIFRVIFQVQRLSGTGGMDLEELFEQFPFLHSYFQEMMGYLPEQINWQGALTWWEAKIRTWEELASTPLPFLILEEGLEVDFGKRLALMLVGLIEEDSRFGTLFETLQSPLPYRQPCLEFVSQLLLDPSAQEVMDLWGMFQSLEESGLLYFSNKQAPRSEWLPRVSLPLWAIMTGSREVQTMDWGTLHKRENFPAVKELVYSSDFLKQVEQLPDLISEGNIQAIILRGSQGSDRIQILSAVARSMGLGLLILSNEKVADDGAWNMVAPLCVMQRVMPVLSYDLAPGETGKVPSLGAYRGPVGIILGHEGGLSGELADQAVTLRVPRLDAAQRLQRWEQAFGTVKVEDLSGINRRFHLPGEYIRRAAKISIAHAKLEQVEAVHSVHVREACRSLNRQLLDKLADRLEGEGSWDQLIVSPNTASSLKELEMRCLHRESFLEVLPPVYDKNSNSGVRALFTGKSGTGKTLAARILAANLGMDLYRVDLAAVINKYVGETEKNLHKVLTRAEELDVVLLLDEGDALLGSRTDVRSANDRYANLETNYLLQKLETYQGIVIVTSNLSDNIDRAFQRRMDVVIHMIPPRKEERLRIWNLHLPSSHKIGPAFLEEAAYRCVFTGGQIRNAALFASLLALDEGSEIQWNHLCKAIQREYQKAGEANPLSPGNSKPAPNHDLLYFADVLD